MFLLTPNSPGPNYAAEVEPFSPFTKQDLTTLQNEVMSAKKFADIGCGYGAIPIELSRRSSVPAIGVDIAPYAIEWARERAAAANVTSVCFQVGTFENTHLPDACVDLVVSVDAFWLTPGRMV